MMWLVEKYLKYIIIYAVLCIGMMVWLKYGCMATEAKDRQMEPAIERSSTLIYDRGSTEIDELKKTTADENGTIVLLDLKSEKFFGVRVIAKPGDLVAIRDGIVFVNKKELKEKYVNEDGRGKDDFNEVIVPIDHIFVLCDTRAGYNEHDSRAFGPVSIHLVKGTISE